MNEGCMYCGKADRGYNPQKNIRFLCGSCIIYFLEMPQEDMASEYVDLTIAYEDLKNEMYKDRMRVLDLFRIPEDDNEQVRPEPKSLSNRKGNPRILWTKERTVRRFKKK